MPSLPETLWHRLREFPRWAAVRRPEPHLGPLVSCPVGLAGKGIVYPRRRAHAVRHAPRDKSLRVCASVGALSAESHLVGSDPDGGDYPIHMSAERGPAGLFLGLIARPRVWVAGFLMAIVAAAFGLRMASCVLYTWRKGDRYPCRSYALCPWRPHRATSFDHGHLGLRRRSQLGKPHSSQAPVVETGCCFRRGVPGSQRGPRGCELEPGKQSFALLGVGLAWAGDVEANAACAAFPSRALRRAA